MSQTKKDVLGIVKRARQRVHCSDPECGWKGQIGVEAPLGKCPQCEKARLRGPADIGRPAISEDERRVEIRAFVLPSTLAWLERKARGGSAGPHAASLLDELASRKR